MKAINTKRWLSVLLVLCMAASLFVTPALAVNVTTTPGGTNLEVEYFTSTLYNWDEDGANEATMEADKQTGGVTSGYPTISQVQTGSYFLDKELTEKVSVQEETTTSDLEYAKAENVTFQMLANQDGTEMATDYFYRTGSYGRYTYYPVYVTRTTYDYFLWTTYSYNLYYKSGSSYFEITDGYGRWDDSYESDDLTSTFSKADLYIHAQTTEYYLTSNGARVEENVTYTATDVKVQTRLYYQSAATGYEGKGFYFTNADTKPEESAIPAFSKWSGTAQNFHIYSGLAESNLEHATNAPFNNDTVNAADLFSTTEYSWKNVYTNVKVPFKYNAETGYYTLNSDENAVYFRNGNAQSGATMVIADKPVHTPENSGVQGAGFQPFEKVSSRTQWTTKSNGDRVEAYTLSDDTATYGFGMVTQVPFQMTDNGKDADGDPIQFRFSGDDDVWVYIDDILVLDIGGTHDAITGTIDFSTGAVTLDALNYDMIGDKATHANSVGDSADEHDTSTLNQTNLYTALGKSLIEFASQGQHTLTIYYMDRGRGKTNCLIEFNLPQRDSVSVTKHVEEYYTGTDVTIPDAVKNTPFTFQLLNNGSPVSFKSYTLYNASNEIIGSRTTSSTGTFTLTNGQRAVFQNISLDDPQTWQVIETSPGDLWTASWEATSSVTTADIGPADGATSGLVTVDGSDTASDSISFVCTNSYKYQTNVSLNVQNESVVIDYGLPVEVDVLANDSVSGNGTITGFEITSQGQYGTATKNDSGKLVYTLNQMLSEIDTVTYTVYAKDNTSGDPSDKTGTLTIIPATSMYYEESFGPQSGDGLAIIYQTNTGSWTPTSDDNTYGTYQETALVGGSSSTYGTDPVYLNNLGDSYGTSRKADVSGGAAQIQYDFTGTGTAIYGRITPNSAYIMVEIKNSENEIVDKQYIDTVVLTNESNPTNLSTLYNIPIYNNDELEYGSYHVRVYIYKAGTPTTHGASGSEFYLDGIRVYCPLGDQSEVTFPKAADQAYSDHGEANVVTANIRYKLTNDGTEGETFTTLTDIENNIIDLAAYGEIGPNEELYLKAGYSVTFAIKNWSSQQYNMFLGMKAPDGSQGVTVKVGNDTYNINNSADCYYDISGSIVTDADDPSTSYVTITGGEGLVSLTNIKVTGTDEYKIVTSGEDIGPADPNMLTFMSVDLASSVNGSTEPPVEETPVFEPDRVKTSCVYSRLLRVATVTVTTSKDVDYVTINGRTVKGVSLFGSTYFTRACTGISKGEEIEIVCYNSDGVASQTYTVTAK